MDPCILYDPLAQLRLDLFVKRISRTFDTYVERFPKLAIIFGNHAAVEVVDVTEPIFIRLNLVEVTIEDAKH